MMMPNRILQKVKRREGGFWHPFSPTSKNTIAKVMICVRQMGGPLLRNEKKKKGKKKYYPNS